MDGYKFSVIVLCFLLTGAISIIVLNSDFENNRVLNPQRTDYQIPEWVKSNAYWWSEGHISDQEFSYSMEFMIREGIISVSQCEGECYDE